MMAAAQSLRIWVFSVEVPGLNADKFFFSTFSCNFLKKKPAVTTLLEHFDPMVYSCLAFAL